METDMDLPEISHQSGIRERQHFGRGHLGQARRQLTRQEAVLA